jgi:thioredoxin reductase/Pyruvate/2-oxoacid:ferredoxin oxidoreductase delta subunit
VTIFEALPVAGGTLAVGIPHFRLPQEVVEKEIDIVRQMGAELRLKTPVGPGLSLDDLRNQGHRAVLLAVGATRGKPLTIPGHDAHGVTDVLDFLKAVALPHGNVDVGTKAVIIGGGNRAVDAARTATRLGADEVTILYNRTSKEIPADTDELREAEAEGVKIRYLSTPTKVLVRNGRVSGIEVAATILSRADSLGRRRVISTEGPRETLLADSIIVALGSTPDLSFLENGLATTRWGTIEVDPVTLSTSMDDIFAAGDAVTGPKTFIEALAAGRKAAISIDSFLRGEDVRSARSLEERQAQCVLVDIEKVDPQPRVETPTLSLQHREQNFSEVNLLPEQEEIVQEAERCLHCGRCTQCDTCLIHCPEDAISKNDHGYVIDYSKCTGCRVCAVECPTSTITMPAVGACISCEYCLRFFECPSLLKDQGGKVVVDRRTCIDCGLCLEVCSQKAIIQAE